MGGNSLQPYIPGFILECLRGIQTGVTHRLYLPSHLKVWMNDLSKKEEGERNIHPSRKVYQGALIDWIKTAQDVTGNGGVAAYYGLRDGWAAPYPETTGYIICTFIDAANRLKDPDLAKRAKQMADWELSIQMPVGAWESGHGMATPIPAVFNTGQVIQGLLCVFEAFGEEKYLGAAMKGGDWLVDIQDKDGPWRKHTYKNFPNTYSTRVAWPLIQLAQATGHKKYEHSATKFLDWVQTCQDEEGWFEHCTLEPQESPLTHTLGYTIEGFIESGQLLNNQDWIRAAKNSAEQLLKKYEVQRKLAGAYGKGWQGNFSFVCVTGCAQMSRNWSRLYEITGDVRFFNGALKLNDTVAGLIELHSSNQGVKGGVKGSHPIWGHYMPSRFPNWAAKFALDAFFQEEDALQKLQAHVQLTSNPS